MSLLLAQVSLSLQTRIVGGIIALAFFLLLLELVRRRRLQERYTIAWFLTGFSLLLAVAVPKTIYWLARLLGIQDTNAALFALVLLAGLGLLLHLTVVVSRLHEQATRLAQELALERAARQAEEERAREPAAADAGRPSSP